MARSRVWSWSGCGMFILPLILLLSFPSIARPSLAVAGAPRGEPGSGDPLRAEMAKHLRSEELTAAVWSLVMPDTGILTSAAGLKHAATGEAMRSDTRVHVGSVAKTVLAAGVLRLVTEGKLGLDTEVATLLPGLAFDNPWQDTDPIRIRHLLEHTAGLENFRFYQVFTLRAHADTPLSEGLRDLPLRVASRPGSRFAYSNLSYHLLGMVIEAVTRTRYESYLDAALLRPLGMQDSTFAFTVQTGPGADPRLAMGHFEHRVAQPAVPAYVRPSVQFTTTAADMGRFAQFLMGDGEIGGRVFIAPQLLAELSGAHATETARAGLPVGHGLALATRDRHGMIGDCHPGTSIGFRAMLCLYPRERKAFFVAVNADVESADYDKLNKSLIAALQLARPVTQLSGAPALQGVEAWEGVYVPTSSAVASLAWVDTVFNPVDVRWSGQLLQFAPLQGKPTRLRPAGGMLFQRDDRAAPSHVLFMSGDDRMLSDGLRTYRQVPFMQILWLWTSAALGALGLNYILLRGLWLLARGRLCRTSTLAVPLACVLLLFVPLPFFFAQSFLQLGDLTIASGLLAFATSVLPFGVAYGAIRLPIRAGPVRHPAFDGTALLAVLQWTLVLAAWGMLPFLMWK